MEKIFTKSLKTNLIFKLLNKFFLFLFVIFFISTALFADVSNKKNKNDKYKFEKDEMVSKAKIYFADYQKELQLLLKEHLVILAILLHMLKVKNLVGLFLEDLGMVRAKFSLKMELLKKSIGMVLQ